VECLAKNDEEIASLFNKARQLIRFQFAYERWYEKFSASAEYDIHSSIIKTSQSKSYFVFHVTTV
jgi:hypothetical protein